MTLLTTTMIMSGMMAAVQYYRKKHQIKHVWENEVILITGVSGEQGFGRLLACELARRGVKTFILWSRDKTGLESCKAAVLEAAKYSDIVVLTQSVDVSDRKKIFSSATTILKELRTTT